MYTRSLKKNIPLVAIMIVVMIFSYQYFHGVQVKYLGVTSFKECVDAGFKVLTTYPEQCVMAGKKFTNPLQKSIPFLSTTTNTKGTTTETLDYKNLTYVIDGKEMTLYNGRGSILLDNASRAGTTTFEIASDPFLYDVNGDTATDTIFLMRRNDQADTKTERFYVAVSLSLKTGHTGTNMLFVDNAVASSLFVYKNGEILLGYTTKSATTTVKQKYFVLEDAILKQLTH